MADFGAHLVDVSMVNDGQGHGHVRPRRDGLKARCGGPYLCAKCAAEKSKLDGKKKEATEKMSEDRFVFKMPIVEPKPSNMIPTSIFDPAFYDPDSQYQSINFSTYQPLAFATAIYPREHAIVYPALGLASEAGEVAGKVKKSLRDGNLDIEALKAELGDVLWYIAALCSDLGISMQEVAEENLRKLGDRKDRGKLGGSGDER